MWSLSILHSSAQSSTAGGDIMEQTLDLAASDNCCLQTSKVAPRVPFPAPDLAFISFHQTPFSWAVTIDFLWRPKTRPLYGPVCPFLTLMATRMGRHTIRRSGIFRSSPPAREKRIVLCGSKWVRGGKAVCFLTLSPIHLSLSLSLCHIFFFSFFFLSLSLACCLQDLGGCGGGRDG